MRVEGGPLGTSINRKAFVLFLDTGLGEGGGRCVRSSVRAERSRAVPSTPHMNMTRGQGRLPGGDVMAYLRPGLRDAT